MSKLQAAYLIGVKRKHSTVQQIYDDVWKSNTDQVSIDNYAQNSSGQSDKSFYQGGFNKIQTSCRNFQIKLL